MIHLHRTGSGKKLILLHCLGMTHRLWDGLMPLADRHEMISYDFPGHGETAVPDQSYGIEDLSAQLHDIMRRHEILRASIMGISLGGLVAQHFAATWPDMTDRLVLADTTARYPDEARANWTVRAAKAREEGAAAMLPVIEKVWFTPGFVAANPPEVEFVRETFRACSGEGYALACEALGAADLRDLTRTIRAPTLVMCGAEESQAFRDAATWLHATIERSELDWVPSAAHATVLEQPAHVIKRLRAFLG